MNNITCCNCGIVFAVTEERQADLRETHDTFYCPNGHPQSYKGPTADEKKIAKLEATIFKRNQQLAAQDESLGWLHDIHAKDSKRIAAMQGVMNRRMRLIVHGCCPICGELANLKSHLKTRHPRFAKKYQNERE